MNRLEYTTAQEFNPKFEDSLRKMEVGNTMVVQFRDKNMLRVFVRLFFNELANQIDNASKEYEHRISELTNSYIIRRLN